MSLERRSSGKVRNQSSVALAVSAIGRNVRPALRARALLTLAKPAVSPPLGTQTGMSLQAWTPCFSRNSGVGPGEGRVALGGLLAGLEHLAHRQRLVGPEGVEDAGRLVLDQPDEELAQVAHVDELDRVVGRAGASTSPPVATRTGQ